LETIVKTQEEVQQSIARDIHDGLVQMMGAAKLTLSAIPVGVGVGSYTTESIQKASSIIDEACQEARHISHQLLPYSLLKDGLASAIEDLLKNAFGDYYFSNDADLQNLRKEHAIHVYRIAQEIINNILKHAEADQIWVEIGQGENGLIISFRDNGRGFDLNQASKGAGLLNIQTRADLLNAVVDVESAPGKGTTIRLTIPNG
jgi:two-component system, NarL family, sensor kinase